MTFSPQQQNREIRRNITKEERLAVYDGPDKIISSQEFLEKLKQEKTPHSFMSGIPSLDLITGGFEAGELNIITGFTGMGKTSFCQSLTHSLAKNGTKALWFSYEVPPRQFFSKFPNGEVPLFYLPAEMKGKDLSWIGDRILEAKIKYDVRAVFIDHLHFIIDLALARNPSLEIGAIVRALKTLAMRLHLAIFLIAHTVKPRENTFPGLESIRDSSFISQEADAVFAIQRQKLKGRDVFSNISVLRILKHRRTGTMGRSIKLAYVDHEFREVSEVEQDQE